MAKKIKPFLPTVDDLVTSREETRAGFISMAIEKNLMATKFVSEARTLRELAKQAKKPLDLIELKGLRSGLLAASGLSNKALKFLSEDDKTDAIKELIAKFLEPAGEGFVDELVYRFLITKGDAVGGSARNLAGSLGDRRFLQCLLSVLSLAGVEYSWQQKKGFQWVAGPLDELNTEKQMNALHWRVGDRDRILVRNIKVPVIKKNVDLVLLDAIPSDWTKADKSVLLQTSRYVALGELKGGVDPAGADEHWKTADTALNKVRTAFQSQRLMPPTFFVGAAIERSMAVDIVDQLDKNVMSKAANLTKDSQLVLLCEWLVNL